MALRWFVVHAENDLTVIGQQYPFEPLEYQRENLRLPFAEGIKMLQDAGFEVLFTALISDANILAVLQLCLHVSKVHALLDIHCMISLLLVMLTSRLADVSCCCNLPIRSDSQLQTHAAAWLVAISWIEG